MSASTVSDLNQKIYGKIDELRNRPLVGDFPYVFLDGLWLKRNWGGEVKNASVLVALGVAQSGYREILGVSEGAKEDKASWAAEQERRSGQTLRTADKLGHSEGGPLCDQAASAHD